MELIGKIPFSSIGGSSKRENKDVFLKCFCILMQIFNLEKNWHSLNFPEGDKFDYGSIQSTVNFALQRVQNQYKYTNSKLGDILCVYSEMSRLVALIDDEKTMTQFQSPVTELLSSPLWKSEIMTTFTETDIDSFTDPIRDALETRALTIAEKDNETNSYFQRVKYIFFSDESKMKRIYKLYSKALMCRINSTGMNSTTKVLQFVMEDTIFNKLLDNEERHGGLLEKFLSVDVKRKLNSLIQSVLMSLKFIGQEKVEFLEMVMNISLEKLKNKVISLNKIIDSLINTEEVFLVLGLAGEDFRKYLQTSELVVKFLQCFDQEISDLHEARNEIPHLKDLSSMVVSQLFLPRNSKVDYPKFLFSHMEIREEYLTSFQTYLNHQQSQVFRDIVVKLHKNRMVSKNLPNTDDESESKNDDQESSKLHILVSEVEPFPGRFINCQPDMLKTMYVYSPESASVEILGDEEEEEFDFSKGVFNFNDAAIS